MNFESILQSLIEKFETDLIDYALIGAFALHAYGYVRATQDIDFIVRSRDQERIVGFLKSLGYETIYCSTGFSNHVHPVSGLGRIDFVYVKGETANRIFQDAVRRSILSGLVLPVADARHIVALKVFAMKNDPDRTLREIADIYYLIRSAGLDPLEVRPFFVKHGLMEKYREISGEQGDDNGA
jgi:hypothetical protein